MGSSLLLLKQNVQQKNRSVQKEIAANRIKNSPEVFTSLLFKQRQVDTSHFENDFLIGDPDAPVKLTMAVNLFCGPCKSELEKAKELLGIYPGQVNLSLRFLKSGDSGKSSGLLLKNWLHELRKRNNGMPDGQSIMDRWYEVMDTEKFAQSYSVNGAVSDTEAEEYYQTHYSWINSAGITQTPTTFINGYELPAAYRVRDLVVLVSGLVGAFDNQHGINKTNVSLESVKVTEK